MAADNESRARSAAMTEIEDIDGITKPIAAYALVFLQYNMSTNASTIDNAAVRLAVVSEYMMTFCTTARTLYARRREPQFMYSVEALWSLTDEVHVSLF